MADAFAIRFEAVRQSHGPLTWGLDPSGDILEGWGLGDTPDGLERFIDTVLPVAVATVGLIKPQSAFYERHGWRGIRARNVVGFEAMDLMLDVVAEPDLSWRWKDREEFEEIVRRGIFDEWLAGNVLAEARAVIDGIERRRPPFDSDWPAWRPDAAWGLPSMTDGWDLVHE